MSVTMFTPLQGLLGGLLIGLSAALWLWLYGRVAGISGIVGGLTLDRVPGDRAWRVRFLLGMVGGAALYSWLAPALLGSSHFSVDLQVGWPGMIVGGLIVGFGTRMGSGCTSGHGVCGIARLSWRSIAATATFMAFGVLTTFVLRHVVGGQS